MLAAAPRLLLPAEPVPRQLPGHEPVMKYRHLFRAVFFQLLLAGFASMAATGKLDPFTIAAYLLLLALAWWKGEAASARHEGFRGWQVAGLVTLFTVFFWLDLTVLSREFA